MPDESRLGSPVPAFRGSRERLHDRGRGRPSRVRPRTDRHRVAPRGQYSFDPSRFPATSRTSPAWRRCRSGIAGPIRINGEHAQGDFYIPMATTEGTLVASYNRGMRLLTECGGVHDDGRGRPHATRAGVHPRRRARGSPVRRVDRRSTRTRSRRRPNRPRSSGHLHRSASTRSGRSATCASTTRPATRPVRT